MAKSKDVADWGRFARLEAMADSSIVASSQGPPGSGKSHFWLTAPAPIAWFLFDPGGLKGLRNNPLFKGKDVRVVDYCGELNIGKLPKDKRVEAAIRAMAHFQEDWEVAVANARTLVVDKETMLWEMLRYAHDEVESPDPKSFDELNLIIRGIVQDAENHSLNLGLIRDIADTWGKTGVTRDGRLTQGYTGVMRPTGNKNVTGLVQINLGHRWDDSDPETRGFKVKILEKCRLGSAKKLIGEEFGDMDFPTLAQTVCPDTDPDVWS